MHKHILPFKDLSLAQKMMYLYVMIVFVPMILMSTFYIRTLSKRLHEQYCLAKHEMLSQSTNAIENNLSQVRFCTHSFQYNTNLMRYVEHYDFSSADGAEMWIKYVRPAFYQLYVMNPEFKNICIWRKDSKKLNDAHSVLNAQDNPYLDYIEPMSYKTMQLLFEDEDEDNKTICKIFNILVDVNHFHKIGYVEVDCSFAFLFQPLNFVSSGELLLLSYHDTVYQVSADENGKVHLLPYSGDSSQYKNSISSRLNLLDMELYYYYPDFVILSNLTIFPILIGMVLLLALFSFAYYLFYHYIVKRITNLTSHMLNAREDPLLPCPSDASPDEIGTMTNVYNEMTARINQLIAEIIQKEHLANQAQYYAMQSQIHPHFLYNTLENIDMLIEVGENQKASQMIALFGKILRYNISRARQLSTIGEETGHIEDYIKLYSFRMREDFSYQIEMEPGCSDIRCPYCMLQPIVENSFKHGFRQEDRELWIHLKVYSQEDYVLIEIEDNGSGITPKRLKQVRKTLQNGNSSAAASASIGLENVNDRIVLLCGSDCGLFVESLDPGLKITVKLKNPILKKELCNVKDEYFNCG